jgi:hypothetical protein
MNKAEFCKLTGLEYHNLSEANFDIINTVYAYHPIISNVKGKKEIADLYKRGGMGIIKDMLDTAEALADAESRMQTNSVLMENLVADQKKELDRLKQDHRDARDDIINDTAGAQERIREITADFKFYEIPFTG